MENEIKRQKNNIWTIPNLLSFFRLALIPVIVWLYVGKGEYLLTLAVVMLSAATDVIDGFIARKYDMVSDFGKALDPVADKLTQLVLLICFIRRFPKMMILAILLVIKEGITGIMSLIAIQKSKTVQGAQWHGKLTTVFLYGTMMLHLVWCTVPTWLSDCLIACCAVTMLYSAARYFMQNLRQICCKECAHGAA